MQRNGATQWRNADSGCTQSVTAAAWNSAVCLVNPHLLLRNKIKYPPRVLSDVVPRGRPVHIPVPSHVESVYSTARFREVQNVSDSPRQPSTSSIPMEENNSGFQGKVFLSLGRQCHPVPVQRNAVRARHVHVRNVKSPPLSPKNPVQILQPRRRQGPPEIVEEKDLALECGGEGEEEGDEEEGEVDEEEPTL